MKKYQTIRAISLSLILSISLCSCATSAPSKSTEQTKVVESSTTLPTETEEETTAWNPIASGNTLATRINTPEGYKRTKVKKGSFGDFVRSYKMKPDGSEVLLYDGTPKGNQNDHVAVFKLPIENRNLQQCADSIMRMYGEYYYSKGEYSKIRFPLGGGFIADFSKWSKGYGIRVNGNRVSWIRNSKNNSSYESFVKFMIVVFAYSGTMNMEDDSASISLDKATIGDIFIKGGSPGHVVMIVDVCKNKSGKKAFLLGQGYMPAQEFHVIKNPMHEEDPWYYESEITYPFRTAEYTFPEGSLKRIKVK